MYKDSQREAVSSEPELASSPGPFEKSDFSNGPGDEAKPEFELI